MKLPWRPAGPVGQTVTGSVVFGDVIQLAGVSGDVVIAADRPPYRVEPSGGDAVPITPEQARAQPSRLLLTRHQVVPFTGRREELSDLAAWMGDSHGVSVRLIHAGGGHGKTRLADYVAYGCATTGWAVWRVHHTPATFGGGKVDMAGCGGLLAVVDYADRWPSSHLLTLVTHLRDLHLRTGATVRVLLLARSARSWWKRIADRLDSEYAIIGTARVLDPLGSRLSRVNLYQEARQRFAGTMQVSGIDDLPMPDALAGEAFASVLSVHMAALVGVDAHLHGADTPTEPHALSAYLLRREAAHWQELHERAEGPHMTSPDVMGRAVYVATLTGPVQRDTARAILRQVAVTEPGPDTIIDEHRFCYPPHDPRTVLQPLYPDRLGEDFLALVTPGHPYADANTGGEPDDWASTAAQALLASTGTEGGDLPVWASAAVAVLVETARRWDHIAVEVLNPLLRARPDLAFAAGGAALTRLAELPAIEADVLVRIEMLLPRQRHVGLDAAAAAVTTALNRRITADLAVIDSADRGALARRQYLAAERLSHAGQSRQAVVHAEEAVARCRNPGGSMDLRDQAALAASLNALASCLFLSGRRSEATRAAQEAMTIARSLATADRATYLPLLAMSLLNAGWFSWHQQRVEDAIAWCDEAVRMYRHLAEANADDHLPGLGLSLNRLGLVLALTKQDHRGCELIEEAVRIFRELAEDSPFTHLPDLAISLHNLGTTVSMLMRDEQALAAIEEAIEIHRRLAEVNKVAYLPDLSTSLLSLGMKLCTLGRYEEAASLANEALGIFRPLVAENPAAYQRQFATCLDTLTIALSGLERHDEALFAAQEAVAIYRDAVHEHPDTRLVSLATALQQLSVGYFTAQRHTEGLDCAQEALAIARQLHGRTPDRHLGPLLATILGMTGTHLVALHRYQEAVPVTAEAVEVCRRLTTSDLDEHLPALAQALWMFGFVRQQAGTDLPQALASLHEALGIFDGLADGQIPISVAMALRLAATAYSDVLDALGRSEEAELIRLRISSEGGVQRRRDAAAEPRTFTLEGLAARMGCPTEGVRLRTFQLVKLGYCAVSRAGAKGPEPVDILTIATHARFTFTHTWPWWAGYSREPDRMSSDEGCM